MGRFDPDVVRVADELREDRKEFNENMASGLGITAEQLEDNQASFDPAGEDCWELSYSFIREGEEVEAIPGDREAFYAKLNGKSVGMSAMVADGWTLISEIGVEIDFDKAWEINKLIKEHKTAPEKL